MNGTSAAPSNMDPAPETTNGDITVVPTSEEAQRWSLERGFKSIHIFFLSISTCIGMGFYVRTGNMDSLGGPAAAFYAYCLLGILTSTISYTIEKMLRVWPVRGALLLYVKYLLDEDLATAVSIVYWLTYCLTAPALTATVADLLSIFNLSTADKAGIMAVVTIIPIFLNCWKIKILRYIGIAMGVFKLLVVVAIIIALNAFNSDLPLQTKKLQPEKRENLFISQWDHTAGWFGGFMSSIFLGSFSFLGIEAVAAAAQEAVRVEPEESIQPQSERRRRTKSDQFSWPARWVPTVITLLYLWGVWAVTANITPGEIYSFYPTACKKSLGIAKAITILIMISLIFTATAALYVSSRTLYGFASDIELDSDSNLERIRKLCLKRYNFMYVKQRSGQSQSRDRETQNKSFPPLNAIFVSSWLLWVPFLKFTNERIFKIVMSLLTDMSSVCCILVWACESFAAMRLYHSYKVHKEDYDSQFNNTSMQDCLDVGDKYWYMRNMLISGFAGVGSLLVVFLGGSMLLVEVPTVSQGLASFGGLVFFMVLVVVLKIRRFRKRSKDNQNLKRWWELNPLDDLNDFEKNIRDLTGAL